MREDSFHLHGNHRPRPYFLPLGLALWVSCGVYAQQPLEPATLDTITVTSQGRTEELQKAAAPIAVFSEVKIQDAGITNTADFVRLVPNMSFDTSLTVGGSFVRMRGIQQIANSDAPVAIVVDGVPQNNSLEFRMDLFDIEQIEVLRGPQGALYGRNAVAGAVVIKTKQPGNMREGFVQATMGGYGLRKLDGTFSGPLLQDRLFYRLSVSGNDFDGALTNTFHDEKVDWQRGHNLRGQLQWHPSENQQLDWHLTSSKVRGGTAGSALIPDPDNGNRWQLPISDILGLSSRQIKSSSLQYRWNGPALALTAITGYSRVFGNQAADVDFCNPVECPDGLFGLGQADQMQLNKYYQLSQELRLGSLDDARVQWTVGAFMLKTRRRAQTRVRLVELDPPLLIADSNASHHNRAWAVFGQVLLPVGERDRLEFSLRRDHDHREQTNLVSGRLANEGSWSAWQPKFTWSHDLSDTRMLYATTGRGFRSGGFNGIGGTPFNAELVTNYELGYKTSWLDQRLTFNTALFYERDTDYQFFYISLAEGGAQVTSNLSRVDIKGLESDINWRVRPGFEVFASLGLLDSSIKETGPIRTDAAITKGRRAPRTEPYNAVIGSQWNFPLGVYRGMFRFDVSRNGTRTWESDNLYLRDPITLINSRFSFFSNQRWNLTLWVNNLLNRRYYGDLTSNNFSGFGRDVVFPAPGRRYGLDFRYDF